MNKLASQGKEVDAPPWDMSINPASSTPHPLKFANPINSVPMRAADPFPMYGPDRCPSFPVSFDQGNMSASMDFHYVVSGQEHRPADPDFTWRGVYTQYAYPECQAP